MRLVHLHGGWASAEVWHHHISFSLCVLYSVCNKCIWVKCWIHMCSQRIGLSVDHWPMAVLWSWKAQSFIRFKLCSLQWTDLVLLHIASSRSHITKYLYCKKQTVEVLTFEPLILLCLGLSKVFENTAMFGDLVLRLPDIVHSIYDKNKDWQLLLGWCYWFCKESGVFDEKNGRLLHLVCFIIICLTVKFCTFFFKDAIFDRRALNLFEEKQSQITPSCVW